MTDYTKYNSCPMCDGIGIYDDSTLCGVCNGSGEIDDR